MSKSLLASIVTEVARTIGSRLPAAYSMEPGDVLVTGDAESHAMPEGAVTVRWALGDEEGYLVISLTADAAEMLGREDSVVDTLSEVVADIGVPLGPLFDDVPPMIGNAEEVDADEALESGPGDAVSVKLDDAGTHRATIGMRLVVTDAMMQAAPETDDAAADAAGAAPGGEPLQDDGVPVDAAGAPLDGPEGVTGGGAVPLTAEQQMADSGGVPPQGAPMGSDPAGVQQQPGMGQPMMQQGPPGIVGAGPAPRRSSTAPTPIAAPTGDAHPADFASFDQLSRLPGESHPMSLLGDVEMGVTAELGRTELTVRDVLNLTPGAIIELDRAAGSPVDVVVNGTLIARGEVVVIDEEFGIRITEIIGMAEVANPFPVAQ